MEQRLRKGKAASVGAAGAATWGVESEPRLKQRARTVVIIFGVLLVFVVVTMLRTQNALLQLRSLKLRNRAAEATRKAKGSVLVHVPADWNTQRFISTEWSKQGNAFVGFDEKCEYTISKDRMWEADAVILDISSGLPPGTQSKLDSTLRTRNQLWIALSTEALRMAGAVGLYPESAPTTDVAAAGTSERLFLG